MDTVRWIISAAPELFLLRHRHRTAFSLSLYRIVPTATPGSDQRGGGGRRMQRSTHMIEINAVDRPPPMMAHVI